MNPILLALDYPDIEQARAVSERVVEHVGGFKVGLELIMAEGQSAIVEIAELGLPVFADAKLHDIPNPVQRAARRLADHGARWVTVHAAGGREMMEAAVDGISGSDGGILAVTVLTSLDEDDLTEVGLGGPLKSRAVSMATLADRAGVEGVVCSPNEVSMLKQSAPRLIAVTPGIRLESSETHDQKRVSSPQDAIEVGADWLVVGRAITGAADIEGAAAAIAETVTAKN